MGKVRFAISYKQSGMTLKSVNMIPNYVIPVETLCK